MPRLVALFRKSSYSPAQHRTNDTAILDDTLAHFVDAGWAVERLDEAVLDAENSDATTLVPGGLVPEADLYLSMCQGPATARLLGLEDAGALLVNRPSSVLGCHRHRLVPALAAAGIRFPATDVVDLAAPGALDGAGVDASAVVRAAQAAGGRVWIKRGDVHAERADDVVAVAAGAVAGAAAEFCARGIGRVALQADVPGPVLKFYGVTGGAGVEPFFRWYDAVAGVSGPRPAVDEARLRALAFGAARALGLEVFGGDVALPAPDAPVLIDLNDWPSFAPFRAQAAAAIAAYALGRAGAGARLGAIADAPRTGDPRGRPRAYGAAALPGAAASPGAAALPAPPARALTAGGDHEGRSYSYDDFA